MKCKDVLRLLSSYADGEASPAEQAQIAAHLRNCAACRAEEAALRQADEALRALAGIEQAPDRSLHLPPRYAGAMLRRPAWLWIGASAAAAMVVFLIVLCIRSPHRSATPHSAIPQTIIKKPQISKKVEPQLAESTTEPPKQSREVISIIHPPKRQARHSIGRHINETILAKSNITERWGRASVKPAGGVQASNSSASRVKPRDETPPPLTPYPDGELQAQAPESAVPQGIILLLGEPRELPRSSSYAVEVTMANGAKSIVEQDIERDSTGATRSVKIVCEQIPAQNSEIKNGG